MLESALNRCLDELTSAPCGMPCPCCKELTDVSMLGGSIVSVGLSGNSSSEDGFSLCLFSPCWSVEVVGGVSSCLSLFLVLSALVGVCKIEVSTVTSCLGGICSYVCCFVEADALAMPSCCSIFCSTLRCDSSCCIVLPLAMFVACIVLY